MCIAFDEFEQPVVSGTMQVRSLQRHLPAVWLTSDRHNNMAGYTRYTRHRRSEQISPACSVSPPVRPGHSNWICQFIVFIQSLQAGVAVQLCRLAVRIQADWRLPAGPSRSSQLNDEWIAGQSPAAKVLHNIYLYCSSIALCGDNMINIVNQIPDYTN